MADAITSPGPSQRRARRCFRWGRDTIHEAPHGRRAGLTCADAFGRRGRKPAESHPPRLLGDIRDLAREHLRQDPAFATTRLSCRPSAAEVRRQLAPHEGYRGGDLPAVECITDRLDALGLRPRPVAECRPQKK